MTAWQKYSDKFLTISPREQYLIIITGLAVLMFVLYNFFIDSALNELFSHQEKSRQLLSENITLEQVSKTYEQALQRDPNTALNQEIAQYKSKLEAVDSQLLSLTSGFIDPIAMRFALLELLNVNTGVSLQSFELIGAEKISLPMVNEEVNEEAESTTTVSSTKRDDFVLYKHGVKLRLSGSYFQLQAYLAQLESLQWRFFWQEFNYNLNAYPKGELEVILYSLSTEREFVGV